MYKTYIATVPVLNYGFLQSIYLLVLLAYLTVSLFKQELTSRALTSQKIKAVESELESVRKTEIHNIGRNLHDQLGNTLASAIGYLNLSKPNTDVAKKMILDAIDEVRLLSHNLVKDDDRNLDEKLENLMETFNDFSPIIFEFKNFAGQEINKLPALKKDSIYMIVQESLSNIIKHSHANEATVQVFFLDGILRFSIEDDGIGYNQTQKPTGIGLINMQKRAAIANLTLVVDSGFGGTMISIETDLTDRIA